MTESENMGIDLNNFYIFRIYEYGLVKIHFWGVFRHFWIYGYDFQKIFRIFGGTFMIRMAQARGSETQVTSWVLSMCAFKTVKRNLAIIN